MQLNFEIINQYTDGKMMDFAHDPDNLFTKYFKKGKHVLNESVKPYRGDFGNINILDELDYNNLVFENEPNRLTAQAISNFGIKNFPQFGSYGWYTTLYSNRNFVVAPINRRRSEYAHPQLSVATTSTEIVVTITDPTSVKYDCYRVMFRKQLFADEFITYERELRVPKLSPGSYDVTAIGYREGGIVSVETDIIPLVIT